MVAQENGGRRHAALLGDLDDRFGLQQRSARAAQRAVGHDADALLLAQIDNLLLRQGRMVLDLVDGRDYFAVREQLLEICFAVLLAG